MQIRRHHDLTELDSDAWDQLAAASAPSTVFQTHPWHLAWWTAFGEHHELLLLSAREGGRLVGIAPLCLAHGRAVRFLGHGSSDYADLLVAPGRDDVREALWRGALEAARGWRRLELRCMLQGSPSLQALRRCAVRGLMDPPTACPTLRVTRPDEFQRAGRRHRVRRSTRWFRRRDGFQVTHHRSPAAVLPLLDDFFAQHCRRWQGTPTPSMFHQPAQRRFYEAAAVHLGQAGALRFTRMSIADRPTAHHFGCVHAGTFSYYKPTFDVDYAARSPGVALLGELLELAQDERPQEFDFSLGDEPYKRLYANDARESVNATFYASSLERGLAAAARAAKELARPILTRLQKRSASA